MADQGFPRPGQRWRSQVDGHTVVTRGQNGDEIFVRFDHSYVSIVLNADEFTDDYTFVETVTPVDAP